MTAHNQLAWHTKRPSLESLMEKGFCDDDWCWGTYIVDGKPKSIQRCISTVYEDWHRGEEPAIAWGFYTEGDGIPEPYHPPNVTHDQYAKAMREAKAVLGSLEPRDSIDSRAVICVIPRDRIKEMFRLPEGASVWRVMVNLSGGVEVKMVHQSFARTRESYQYPVRVLGTWDKSKPPRIGWLGILNRCVLQWLCVRLARKIDEDDKPVGWTLLRWVRPRSGYGGRPFVYLWKLKDGE